MNAREIKQRIPWRVKFWFKALIGRLYLTEAFHKLRIFVHGVNTTERNFRVFETHFQAVKEKLPPGKDFTMLELGPGYSLSSAVFARHFGASFTYLVDQGRFVSNPKKDLARAQNFMAHKYADYNTEPLRHHYFIRSLDSLKTIPSNSVDFIFSNAVLEHIRLDEVLAIFKELRRILRPGGVASHVVDLKDHLNSSLNHLRFSDRFWESALIRNSGFYTNRLLLPEWLQLFSDAGFEHSLVDVSRFDNLPINRQKLDQIFQKYSDHNLVVSGFHVLLTPKNS